MEMARRFGEQLARPTGWGGRVLGSLMDLANRNPTRWSVDQLDPQPGERILDAGCGTGAATFAILRKAHCRVVGVDRSRAMIDVARRRAIRAALEDTIEFYQGDLAEPNFAAGRFDAALALNVLYFADREGAMVGGLRRALRPGGRLVAYVTDRASMENWAFAKSGTHRLFDRAELAAALEAGGFERSRIRIEARPVTRTITGLFATAFA